MHRLHSQSSLFRFRLVAYLLFLGPAVMTAGLVMLLYTIFVSHQDKLLYAALLMAAGFTLIIVQWVTSIRARCPLCLTPALAKKACSKNRNAKTLLGSYRMRAAASIIFRNRFRCPYCNEPTVLEVRPRHAR